MRRLYLQIYLTIVASLVLVVVTAGAAVALHRGCVAVRPGARDRRRGGVGGAWRPPTRRRGPAAGDRAPGRAAATPTSPCSAPTGDRLAGRAPAAAPHATATAAAGCTAPAARPGRCGCPTDAGWWRACAPRHRHPGLALVAFLGAIALAVALAACPVARRLTRRLERLQRGVEQLGAGDLSARVKVEGRDEVARLAASFNRAAARIEELVGAHKLLLANASHELRTPLARIRLGWSSRRSRSIRSGRRSCEGHRRARPADRRNPAGEPPRCARRARDQRGRRPARARGRGMRALRGMRARRHVR